MKKADVRIDSSGVKDRPYTIQHGGCGEAGLYIHFSPDYITTLTEEHNIKKYGKPGKVFVHEWAHHRYGVFDEYGEAGDPKHPLFYRRQGSSKIYPNICTNIQPIFYTRSTTHWKMCLSVTFKFTLMFTFAIFREMIRRFLIFWCLTNLIQTKVKYQMKMIHEQIIFWLIGTSTPTATVKSISRRKFTMVTVVITLTKLLSRRHRWLHIITRIRYVQIVEFIEIVIRSLFLVNQY